MPNTVPHPNISESTVCHPTIPLSWPGGEPDEVREAYDSRMRWGGR